MTETIRRKYYLDKLLSYKETKRLIEEYPYDFLEFEVVFATAISKGQ